MTTKTSKTDANASAAAKADIKAEVKTATSKPTEKVEKPVTLTEQRIKFLKPLIEQGKFTKMQLVEKALVKFPDQKVGLVTLLSDSKNPKYNKFALLVVQDANKLLSFKK